MRVALVHDWLTGMRGGEKCLEVFCQLFPDADLYTLLHIPGKLSPSIERMKIHTSFIQKMPFSKRGYRNYLPFFPTAIEQFDLRGYDMVLSSSHCVAKGVITQPMTCHISYIHTPMRYVWELYNDYFGEDRIGWLKRKVVPPITNYLRMWDVASSNRVDYYLANSHHVARRVKKHYQRDARVINPPVNFSLFDLSEKTEDYFLIVSALAPYKRIDLAIETFNQLKLPLKIIGTGEMEKKLRQMAGPNIEFLGWRTDEEVCDYYMRCRAFIFPQEEDFGITPLEAQACGKPVIALGRGGALETVIGAFAEDGMPSELDHERLPAASRPAPGEAITGVFFRRQTVTSLAYAVRAYQKLADRFDPAAIRRNAMRFATPRFAEEIKQFITEKYAEFRDRMSPRR